MFFTQEDYRKIEEYLKLNSKKDTDFPIITSVTDDDYVAVILNNQNRIISIQDLRESIVRGVAVSITASPDTIYAETTTKVTIRIQVSKVVSSITLYKNESLIGRIENNNFLLIEEDIITTFNSLITYKAIVNVDDVSYPVTRQTTLTIEKKNPDTRWNLESTEFKVDTNYSGSFPQLLNVPTGATVTYISLDENVATINSLGVITIVGQGNTNITASVSETNAYKGKTITYSLIVNKAGYIIRYGAGSEYTDATTQASVRTTPEGTYNIDIPSNGSYVFLVVPRTMNINRAEMSSFDFPLEEPVNVEIEGMEYKYYRSSNTYDAGTLTIVIL